MNECYSAQCEKPLKKWTLRICHLTKPLHWIIVVSFFFDLIFNPYFCNSPECLVVLYWYFLVEICHLCVQNISLSNLELSKMANFVKIRFFFIKVWEPCKIVSALKSNLETLWHYAICVLSWFIYLGNFWNNNNLRELKRIPEHYGWLEGCGWLECLGWLRFYCTSASLEGLDLMALIQRKIFFVVN